MPRAINSLSPRTKFAKRHYEAIGLAMQDARFHLRSSTPDQWQCTIKSLADMLAQDNKQFQRDRARPQRSDRTALGPAALCREGLYKRLSKK